MSLEELEKYLVNLSNDYSVRMAQDKMVAINNLLAVCNSIQGLTNTVNSEIMNDNYKYFMTTHVVNFSNGFVNAAMQRLGEFGLNGMGMMGGGMPMGMQTPFQQPFQQMPQMMPPQMPQMPQIPQMMQQQPVQQFAQPMQQQFAQPVSAPAQQQAPPPVQQQAPPPVQQQAPPPVQQAPAPTSSGGSSLDKPLDFGDSPASAQSSTDFALPGMGGDGPAAGRDFLLKILNK